MAIAHRALQNPDREIAQPVPLRAGRRRVREPVREPERVLSALEIDALLASANRFARRGRVYRDFDDNHSGVFQLFRIY